MFEILDYCGCEDVVVTLKMETACFSEILPASTQGVTAQQSASKIRKIFAVPLWLDPSVYVSRYEILKTAYILQTTVPLVMNKRRKLTSY
jgi:hypothetical protein